MAYIQPKNLTLNLIKKQTVKVEKLVGEKYKIKDTSIKKQRFLNERKRFEDKERKIEDRGDSDEKQVSNKMPVPKLGFLDVVKNFLFKVLLGAFAIKLLPQLPKLKGLLIGAMKFSEFILQFAGSLLNALVTFVDKVYKIVDFGKQQAKLLGGDAGLKNYNKTLDLANKVMNSMFIAGMLFSDLVESDAKGSVMQQGVDAIKDRVIQQGAQRAAQQAAIRGAAQFGARAAAGTIAGVGLISSALGEGAFQLRKFTLKIQKDADEAYVEALKDKNPFMRFIKSAFYGGFVRPGMMFTNYLLNGLGTLLDVVGAPFRYAVELINYGIMLLTGDAEGIKKQRENLGKFDARIREQIREMVNTLSFGTLAKERGSFGSLFGSDATKAMGYAQGGEVSRGGVYAGAVTRTVGKTAKAKRVVSVPTAPLQPGSDVGGTLPYGQEKVSKIETFYPNPTDPGTVSSYRYLKSAYDIAGATKFLHPLLEITIKVLFGDKPPESDFKAVGAGLNNFINDILDTTKVPGKDISISDQTGPVDISNWVSSIAKSSMMNPINSILSNLIVQLTLKKSSATGKEQKQQTGGGGGGTENPLAQFGGEAQFVIGDSIAHGFAGRSGSGSESGDTMVGRNAAAVLAILKAKGDALKGALIDLSTGIANSTADFNSVEEQLKYLKSIGVRARILGVGNEFSKSKGGINEKLAQLASKYGFYFYGGYKGGKDKLHGTDEDYTNLKSKREKETAAGLKAGSIPQGNISMSQLVQLATAAGFAQNEIPTMVAIAMAESGGNSRAHNPVPPDNSYGLWQINMIDTLGPDRRKRYGLSSNEELFDPATNARVAKRIRDEQGLTAWTTYSGGAYKKFLSMVQMPSKQQGGPVYKTEEVLTHPGEYIIDADSVKLFGINFYDIINKVETASQRKNAADSLVSILSQYTEDGYPETEDDYTYEVPESSTVTVIPPEIIPISGGSSGFGGGGEDPSQDGLYM
jgi:hypothetical protein